MTGSIENLTGQVVMRLEMKDQTLTGLKRWLELVERTVGPVPVVAKRRDDGSIYLQAEKKTVEEYTVRKKG